MQDLRPMAHLLNQNLHFNKISRWLTYTLNFMKHCPRPGEHQVTRASQLQWDKSLIAVLSQRFQLFAEVGRAWILQSQGASCSSHAQAVHLPWHHINTGLVFLHVHEKRSCTFHVLLCMRKIKYCFNNWGTWTSIGSMNSILQGSLMSQTCHKIIIVV